MPYFEEKKKTCWNRKKLVFFFLNQDTVLMGLLKFEKNEREVSQFAKKTNFYKIDETMSYLVSSLPSNTFFNRTELVN